MSEALNGLKRTKMCGELREENIGETITVMGWVQRKRNLGGLLFMDLRDRTGMLQVVFQEDVAEEVSIKGNAIRPEYCIAVTGVL